MLLEIAPLVGKPVAGSDKEVGQMVRRYGTNKLRFAALLLGSLAIAGLSSCAKMESLRVEVPSIKDKDKHVRFAPIPISRSKGNTEQLGGTLHVRPDGSVEGKIKIENAETSYDHETKTIELHVKLRVGDNEETAKEFKIDLFGKVTDDGSAVLFPTENIAGVIIRARVGCVGYVNDRFVCAIQNPKNQDEWIQQYFIELHIRIGDQTLYEQLNAQQELPEEMRPQPKKDDQQNDVSNGEEEINDDVPEEYANILPGAKYHGFGGTEELLRTKTPEEWTRRDDSAASAPVKPAPAKPSGAAPAPPPAPVKPAPQKPAPGASAIKPPAKPVVPSLEHPISRPAKRGFGGLLDPKKDQYARRALQPLRDAGKKAVDKTKAAADAAKAKLKDLTHRGDSTPGKSADDKTLAPAPQEINHDDPSKQVEPTKPGIGTRIANAFKSMWSFGKSDQKAEPGEKNEVREWPRPGSKASVGRARPLDTMKPVPTPVEQEEPTEPEANKPGIGARIGNAIKSLWPFGKGDSSDEPQGRASVGRARPLDTLKAKPAAPQPAAPQPAAPQPAAPQPAAPQLPAAPTMPEQQATSRKSEADAPNVSVNVPSQVPPPAIEPIAVPTQPTAPAAIEPISIPAPPTAPEIVMSLPVLAPIPKIDDVALAQEAAGELPNIVFESESPMERPKELPKRSSQLIPAPYIGGTPASQAVGKLGRLDNNDPQPFLRNATEADLNSRYYRILMRSKNQYFGTRILVDMIENIAKAVMDLIPNFQLPVAAMSQKHGGSIGHKSHKSGLDVDLGFMAKQVDNSRDSLEDMVTGNSVKSGGGTLSSNFNVADQWTILKAVATTKMANWIFVHSKVKRALCEHAKSVGETNTADGKAALRLAQIENNHYDHWHLRLQCTDDNPRCIQDAGPGYNPEITFRTCN